MLPRARKLNLFELAAVTYMMVSGGPYGIEELIGSSGYGIGVLVLLLVPLVWSLPVGLMVGELAAAIPADGGYYIWVRRALGPFWGFQEAWLSLAASVFDMTAYLALFVLCLSRIWAPAQQHSFWIGSAIVVISVAWNLLGAKPVGDGSLLMMAILLAPFVPLLLLAMRLHASVPMAAANGGEHDFLAGLIAAMWNYMGWDNASTIAAEVENPQRIYPRVMLMALGAVAFSYIVPVLAVWHAGLPVDAWSTGSWISIARTLGGEGLGMAMAITALVSTFGIFNSLTLSISRVPLAMAETRCAPRFLGWRLSNGVPWAAIVACGILWISALGLSFDRLLLLDILLYGASLMLEFAALILLRVREPELRRPFRMPGGLGVAILAAVGPLTLLILALIQGWSEKFGELRGLSFGAGIAVLGFLAYFIWEKSAARQASAG